MKVYVVTEGEYSQCTIEGVFLRRDQAEEFKNYYCFDVVEEYELDPATPQSDGDMYRLDFYVDSKREIKLERISNHTKPHGWTCDCYAHEPSPTSARCVYKARDMDHAQKIAGDKLMHLKAGSLLVIGREGRYEARQNPDGTLSAGSDYVRYENTYMMQSGKFVLTHTEKMP